MKTLEGPGCRILYRGNSGPCVIVYESGERDRSGSIFGLVTELCPGTDFSVCIVPVDDWNRDLSPWREECCGSVFEGKGDETLAGTEKEILPFIGSVFPESRVYAAGYSLAGLFALYALYRLPSLAGAAACSGSLWFPEWFDRTSGMTLPGDSKVYLSLGGKEEKTSDPVMATVGKAYQRQFEILKKAGTACTYEKNPGGHFKEPDLRLAKGIAWLLRQ